MTPGGIVSCDSRERELLSFFAAGTLEAAEEEAVLRHVEVCAACREELAASRELVAGLRTLHLTSEEVVSAAESGIRPPHLEACPRCRHEVEMLAGIRSDLERHDARPSRSWIARPARAALAAALLLGGVGLVFLVREHGALPPPGPPSPEEGATRSLSATATLLTAGSVALRISGDAPLVRQLTGALADDLAATRRLGFASDPGEADLLLTGSLRTLPSGEIELAGARLLNADGAQVWPETTDDQAHAYEGSPEQVSSDLIESVMGAIRRKEGAR